MVWKQRENNYLFQNNAVRTPSAKTVSKLFYLNNVFNRHAIKTKRPDAEFL
jgi:hypothetical protein